MSDSRNVNSERVGPQKIPLNAQDPKAVGSRTWTKSRKDTYFPNSSFKSYKSLHFMVLLVAILKCKCRPAWNVDYGSQQLPFCSSRESSHEIWASHLKMAALLCVEWHSRSDFSREFIWEFASSGSKWLRPWNFDTHWNFEVKFITCDRHIHISGYLKQKKNHIANSLLICIELEGFGLYSMWVWLISKCKQIRGLVKGTLTVFTIFVP